MPRCFFLPKVEVESARLSSVYMLLLLVTRDLVSRGIREELDTLLSPAVCLALMRSGGVLVKGCL